MQPYQEASQEIQRQQNVPGNILKSAASIAGGVYGGSILTRMLPFFNKYITPDLAKKGLSKLDPRLGKFIDQATSSGKSIEDALSFIKDKILPQDQKQESQAEERNILEQYSPELFQFVKGQIDSGRAPLEAGALAQLDNKFKNVIKKMEADHKTPFSSILASVFGEGQQQPQVQQQQPQQQNPQASGQGISPKMQQFMEVLQKYQQSKGA